MENVAHYLNGRIHQQARQLIATYQDNPKQHAFLQLDKLMSDFDPVLLNFINQLTQTLRQSRRKLFNDVNESLKSFDTSTFCVLYSSASTYAITCCAN